MRWQNWSMDKQLPSDPSEAVRGGYLPASTDYGFIDSFMRNR
jgi:hypothetical protein